MNCIKERVRKDSSHKETVNFLRTLKDTFNYWVKNVNVDLIQSYSKYDYNFSDVVVFDDKKTRGLGFVVRYRKNSRNYDDIKIICGEKISEKWYFYFLSYFNYHIVNCEDCIKENGKIPMSYMNDRVLNLIVNTLNFYNSNTCDVREEFFTRRINARVRFDHQHRFLSGTYPLYDAPIPDSLVRKPKWE